jgi:hypothetical protein
MTELLLQPRIAALREIRREGRSKNKNVPELFRVSGRPNSPPPELLRCYASCNPAVCELHFWAMR